MNPTFVARSLHNLLLQDHSQPQVVLDAWRSQSSARDTLALFSTDDVLQMGGDQNASVVLKQHVDALKDPSTIEKNAKATASWDKNAALSKMLTAVETANQEGGPAAALAAATQHARASAA